MKRDLKKGDVVKFKKVLNPEKAAARMVILSDPGGGRVLVRNLSEKQLSICLYIDELELFEQELHQ